MANPRITEEAGGIYRDLLSPGNLAYLFVGWKTDLSGRLLQANQAYAAAIGRPLAELLGMPIQQFGCSEPFAKIYTNATTAKRSISASSLETIVVRGRPAQFRTVLTLHMEQGQPKIITGMAISNEAIDIGPGEPVPPKQKISNHQTQTPAPSSLTDDAFLRACGISQL